MVALGRIRCFSFFSTFVQCKTCPAQVDEQEVLAITFDPDKAVACFLPPEEPVVLTKGLTPKPTRRGGMGRAGAKHELMSIPDTAAGESEDWAGKADLFEQKGLGD